MKNLREAIYPYSLLSKNIGNDQAISPVLILGIIAQESYGEQWATRYEPEYKYLFLPLSYKTKLGITLDTEVVHQKTSWGLMQLMGGVARELGFEDHMPSLCHPATNIVFGVKKLSQLHKKYSHIEDIISAYNSGTPFKENGRYKNQDYVDGVMRYMREIAPWDL